MRAAMLACLAMASVAAAPVHQEPTRNEHSPVDRPLTRVRFTDALRRESRTRTEGSTTESVTISSGRVSMDFEITLEPGERSDFRQSTPIRIKAGSLDLATTLSSEPAYHEGDSAATARLTSPTESGNSRVIAATVRLRWGGGRLTGTVDVPATGKLRNIAAEDFAGKAPGPRPVTSWALPPGKHTSRSKVDVNGETAVRVEIGGITAECKVPFRGRVDRDTLETEEAVRETAKVLLSGEFRKP